MLVADTTVQEERQSGGRMRLRRSDMTNIERARSRTLRMTITIVAAFIWCWTPYVVMTLWIEVSATGVGSGGSSHARLIREG
uniref:(California timema) hypothetical protein n=1 Tax=Timema californicum TaxID=61474 RepID=A0A7R9PC51_TIMCA|nr:unnamed protein product [Timema californicum]